MSICSDVGTKYCNMNDAIMTFVIITISCRIIILFPSIAPNVLKKCQQDSNHFAKENHSLSVEGIFKYVRHMSWWIASQVSLTIVEIVVWLMQKLYSKDLKVSPVARYLNITAILSSGLILLCTTVSFFSTQQAIWSTRNHYKRVCLLSPALSQVYYNIHLSFFFFPIHNLLGVGFLSSSRSKSTKTARAIFLIQMYVMFIIWISHIFAHFKKLNVFWWLVTNNYKPASSSVLDGAEIHETCIAMPLHDRFHILWGMSNTSRKKGLVNKSFW